MSRKKQPGHSRGTPALGRLVESGVEHIVHSYDHDEVTSSAMGYGVEAARAMGISPDRVFKTLMVLAGRKHVLGVVPVSRQLDLKAMASALGAKQVVLARPDVAERVSGSVVGGISPLGDVRRWTWSSTRRRCRTTPSWSRRGSAASTSSFRRMTSSASRAGRPPPSRADAESHDPRVKGPRPAGQHPTTRGSTPNNPRVNTQQPAGQHPTTRGSTPDDPRVNATTRGSTPNDPRVNTQQPAGQRRGQARPRVVRAGGRLPRMELTMSST